MPAVPDDEDGSRHITHMTRLRPLVHSGQ